MENPAITASVNVISADPQKWRTLLNQFEDVLQINIFIVDPHGRVIVSSNSQENQQGGGFFGVAQEGGRLPEAGEFLRAFGSHESYFRTVDPLLPRLFVVPVKKEAGGALFYLIAGPVPIGQISEAALNAVLDLLSEIVKDVYELAVEKQKLVQMQNHNESVRPEIIDAVQDLLVDIQHDELLIAILDAAIKMAGAEGGSMMILDEDKKDFVIKVSRGLDTKKSVVRARFKLGEGIAGIAAQEKTTFFISGTEGDQRIQHLLKRSDIRQSFVVPIIADFGEHVIAILNLSIKNKDTPISVSDVHRDIQKLSPLIATALRSV